MACGSTPIECGRGNNYSDYIRRGAPINSESIIELYIHSPDPNCDVNEGKDFNLELVLIRFKVSMNVV